MHFFKTIIFISFLFNNAFLFSMTRLPKNIIHAVKIGDIKTLKNLAKDRKTLLGKNKVGDTILTIAVKSDQIESAKELLKYDEVVKNIDSKSNNALTALMWAVLLGSFDMVKLLVDAGCSIGGKTGHSAYNIAKDLKQKNPTSIFYKKIVHFLASKLKTQNTENVNNLETYDDSTDDEEDHFESSNRSKIGA